MKKRRITKTLSLRKDTVRTLGLSDLGQVAGGLTFTCDSANVHCNHTEDQVCIETTIAPGCVPHNTVGCEDTFGCTNTCNLDCTNGCTLGCPTITSGGVGC